MCNQVVISIAKNPVHHDQTKHVEIDHHFIKEKIEEMMISLVYTPTTLQIVDILTKALFKTNFEDLRSKLGTWFEISVNMDISILEFYGYIKNIGKISWNISKKNSKKLSNK